MQTHTNFETNRNLEQPFRGDEVADFKDKSKMYEGYYPILGSILESKGFLKSKQDVSVAVDKLLDLARAYDREVLRVQIDPVLQKLYSYDSVSGSLRKIGRGGKDDGAVFCRDGYWLLKDWAQGRLSFLESLPGGPEKSLNKYIEDMYGHLEILRGSLSDNLRPRAKNDSTVRFGDTVDLAHEYIGAGKNDENKTNDPNDTGKNPDQSFGVGFAGGKMRGPDLNKTN